MKKDSIVALPLIAAAVIAFGCGGAGQSAGHKPKAGGDGFQIIGGTCGSIGNCPGSDPIREEWTAGTQFNPDIAYGTLNDERDGKTYRTVKIGNLVWMAENLNYQTDGSRCWDNKEDNCPKYGRLYSWDAAKNACPAGWRIPFGWDWYGLGNFAAKIVRRDDPAAKAAVLSSTKKDFWKGRGTDDLGFSALPGGTHWWSIHLELSALGQSSAEDRIWGIDDFRGIEYNFAERLSKDLNNPFAYLRCVQDNPDAAPQAPAESESAPPGAN